MIGIVVSREWELTSRTNYVKQDEEDEKQAFLGEEVKFQSLNCEVAKFLNRNSEQLGMNAPLTLFFLTWCMCSVMP
jgi:hypothetical protein